MRMTPTFWTRLGLAAAALAAAAVALGASAPGAFASAPAPDPDSGAELIGAPAKAWTFDRWLRTKPLALKELRGKVVLLRWWTEGCHYCTTTLPVLDRVREREAANGLVVIGVFHPKPPRVVSDRHIIEVARQIGFTGPIAVDQSWSTLDRYWLDDNPKRNWTSVSFLIDRNGVIRWVHGGGEYHPSDDPRHASCDLQYRDFEKTLATVLAEKPTASR